jgi:AcrR family transcriptional regulator
MSTNRQPHPREAIAERNLEAILDAAERLLSRGEQPSMSAVAHEAGVSRPTVYAHFPDRPALIEALVKRTVSEAMAAINAAEVGHGPAADALARLIPAAWQQLAAHDQIGRAAASDLSSEAMRAAHHSAREAISELIERGRQEGSFRTDLPTGWLVSSSLALIHAAAEEVRNGQLDPQVALRALELTIPELIAGQLARS